MVLGTIGLFLGGFTPLSTIILLPLDQRFPPFSENGISPTGVIVLGGGFEVDLSEIHDQFVGNDADERQIYMADLARRFPESRIIFSGGGTVPGASINEADVIARYAEVLSLPRSRLILDNRSRNTYENARFTADLVKPKPAERWILVTSAWHMPRAVGCFRKFGFTVVPFPVDYRTGRWHSRLGFGTPVSERLTLLDMAVKEWIGLAAYRIAGNTSDWLPGPEAHPVVIPAGEATPAKKSG
jgi:uncharacterized SAM-binding protein YcdF (DUF218 family)